mmetsp:Transcript_57799/g.183230  ORF Transcript_57799/g.183230 Transcript_57799/m.183230 type:complete len:190 (+) Transcript_57799:68-637(+)
MIGDAFDASKPAPGLIALVESGAVDVKGKTVLVPGCGRGYDLALFSKHGASKATGLEISETAAAAAKDWLQAAAPEAPASVEVEDFFQYAPDTPADLVYDYTFFCAIHPSLRAAWGQKMGELVRPGGELITMQFPLVEKPEGPPYGVSREAYAEVLGPHGFEEFYNEVPEKSHPDRGGKERVGRWRKRT